MNDADKNMPSVIFECTNGKSSCFMVSNYFRGMLANKLGVESLSTPARVIGLFLNKCGFDSNDCVKIYDCDLNSDDFGQSVSLKLAVNGEEGHNLKVSRVYRRGQGYLNEFFYTDREGNECGYELRTIEKRDSRINYPDVSITVKPIKLKVYKDERFVSYVSTYKDNLGYWTRISTGTLMGNENEFPAILINYWGDDHNPLTLESDAPISVKNFSQLCDYLNGLSLPYNFIDVYKRACALSFNVEDYSSFEIIGDRPLTHLDSCGRKFTRKCYADQIKMHYGKLDMFGFGGIHIWDSGAINAFHNGDIVHDTLFTYQPGDKYDESVVPAIRLAVSKLVRTFTEESFAFLGLETGTEEGLLADVWRENSSSEQYSMLV